MSFLTKLPEHLYPRTAFGPLRPDMPHQPTALALAWFSQLAYETDEPEKCARLLRHWGFALADKGIVRRVVATPLPIVATEVIVARTSSASIITFAGTDPLSLADWITDLNIALTPDDLAAGFDLAFKAVREDLDMILDMATESKPLYVTGHSLGGALAVLCARHVERRCPGSVAAVYTFGMPRAMGMTAASDYDRLLGSRTLRCVHGEDIVPSVPPDGFAFRHVGRLLRTARGKRFSFKPGELVSNSNDPGFSDVTVRTLLMSLSGTDGNTPGLMARLKGAVSLAFGSAWPGRRKDVVGSLLELLPPAIRDHLPDCYIKACSSR